nr:MAG TPA: hypothetical protein [Caudoviricetes sp.]
MPGKSLLDEKGLLKFQNGGPCYQGQQMLNLDSRALQCTR